MQYELFQKDCAAEEAISLFSGTMKECWDEAVRRFGKLTVIEFSYLYAICPKQDFLVS